MMLKKIILIAFMIKAPDFLNAQENSFIVVKANEIVGDTIDRTEKIKYSLYPQFSSENFKFAQYLMKGDQIILRVNFIDSTYYDQQYSLDLIYQDADNVEKNKNRAFVEPKSNYRKVFIQITDLNSKKSIKLKRREVIQLKIKDEPLRLAKIKRIDVNSEPTIYIDGGKVILPISKIEYIYRMPIYLHVLIKTDAVLFSMAGLVGVLAGKENILIVSPFIVGGVAGFLVKNKKFYIDNSSIDVIYK